MRGAMNGASNNSSLGYRTLAALTSGQRNTAIGQGAGDGLTTAHRTVIVGDSAGSGVMITNSGGSVPSYADGTVAVGFQSLYSLTTGAKNTAIGYSALAADTDGGSNVVIGYEAGKQLTGSTRNTIVGQGALSAVDGTADNLADCVVIGYEAFKGDATNTTTGANGTTAIGSFALNALTSGAGNVALGYNAGLTITTGERNTILGYAALDGASTETDDNVAIGWGAMGGSIATEVVNDCVAIGSQALSGNLDSTNGVDEASGSIAIGLAALGSLTTGHGNTAVGFKAMFEEGTGSNNTVVGYGAMDDSLTTLTNNNNTFIGYDSGGGTWVTTASTGNTALGSGSMNGALNDADDNTIIGYSANPSAVGAQNQTVIGKGATGQADNSVTLGNADVTAVYMAQDSQAKIHCGALDVETAGMASDYPLYVFNDGDNANRYGVLVQGGADDASGTTYYLTCRDGNGDGIGYIANTSGTFALTDPSDRRLKKDIVDTSVKGLETVAKMKVRDFEWKKSGDKCTGGFIAQELKEVFAPAVQGTDGAVEDILDDDGNKTGERIVPMGVSRDVLVPVLVKAIQELTAKVEALEAK